MIEDREKGPEIPGPGVEGGDGAEEIEKTESGEDILKGVLGDIESREKTRRIEDEAYEEKEERERYGEAKQKEQEYYKRTLECSYKEGTATYMAFETSEKIDRLSEEKRLSRGKRFNYKDKEQVIQESLEYLKTLDYERKNDFKQYVDSAMHNERGASLRFGSFTFRVENGFNKKEYLEAMKEISQIQDQHWEGKEEELKTNEILVLREKRDRQARTKHLEGFGATALEYGDLDTAVDAFIEGDLVGNPEIAKKVAEKMKEMIQSEKPEVRAKVFTAKESIKKYFEGEKEEGGEKE